MSSLIKESILILGSYVNLNLNTSHHYRLNTMATKRKRNDLSLVESALLTWFKDARSRDATITSAILEEKATQLANKLELKVSS